MQLIDLRLQRLPGIDSPFSIQPEPAITLIVGPNGSGKSSLTRAFLQLLWPASGSARPSEVVAEMIIGQERIRARRENDDAVIWSRDGLSVDAPALPPNHLTRCYRLGMLDLNRADADESDEILSREILTQMAGGFDLNRVRDEVFTVGSRAGFAERDRFNEARAQSHRIQTEQRDLARKEATLDQHKADLEDARRAGFRRAQLERIQRHRSLLEQQAVANSELSRFPTGIQSIRSDDPQTLTQLRERVGKATSRLGALEASLQRQRVEIAGLTHNTDGDPAVPDSTLAAILDELRRSEDGRNLARRELSGALASEDSAADNTPSGAAKEPVDEVTYREIVRLHAESIQIESLRNELGIRQRESDVDPGAGKVWTSIVAAIGAIGLALGAWWTAQPAVAPEIVGLIPALIVVAGSLVAFGVFRLAGYRRGGSQRSAERLQEQLAAANADQERVHGELRELASRHGLDLSEPNLIYALKTAELALEIEQSAARLRGELQGWTAQYNETLGRFNRELERLGLLPVQDGAQADTALNQWKERQARLLQLTNDVAKDEEIETDLRGQIQRDAGQIESLLERLGLSAEPDPDDQVEQLAADLPSYEATRRRRDDGNAQLEQLQREIAEHEDSLEGWPVDTWSDDELQEHLDRDALAAERVVELAGEIAEIQAAIKRTRERDDLADAQAREERCEADLVQVREQSRDAALGALLVEQVRVQNETHSRPAVWSEAVDLFRRFTANRWELLVQELDGQGRFAARDINTGDVVRLSNLSDGTRSQLLLAVRLAFLTLSEDSSPLPLFLDDALTASDPERFTAVAIGLGELARDQQRQVIYATANPADVALFQRALAEQGLPQAHVIDLARVRGLASSPDPIRWSAAIDTPIPTPDGADRRRYAEALLAPSLAPWQPATQVHLIHLFGDDAGELDLLHRLLIAGATTIGGWRSARSALKTAGTVSAPQDKLLDFRVRVLVACLEGWRIGRSRPVGRMDLEDSGAVSARMLPKVLELLLEVDGDAVRLIDALESRAVKNFREDKIAQLRDHLEREGFISPLPALDQDALVLQVIKSLGNAIAEAGADAAEVRIQVGRFLRAISPEPQESAGIGS